MSNLGKFAHNPHIVATDSGGRFSVEDLRGQPQSASEVSPMIGALTRLADARCQLIGRIEELARRLVPVSLPLPAAASNAEAGCVRSAAPLVVAVHDEAEHIERATSRLSELISQLEI